MPKRKFDQQADEVEKIVDIIRSLEKDTIQELESGQDGWKTKIDSLLKYLQPNQLSGAIFASVKSLDRIFSKCINHIHCTELDPPFVFQSENKFEEVRNTELELQLLRQSATALEASSNRNSLLSKLNLKVGTKEATPTQQTDSSKWNITLQDNHLLRKKFTEYLMTASNLLHHDDQGLHAPVWKTLMGYVNHELQESKQRKSMLIAWESLLFDFMIYSMVQTNSVSSQELMNELKQLLEYDDIKYMVLSALGQYAGDSEKARNAGTTQMLYQLASEVHIPPQVTKFYSSKDRSPEQLAVLLKAQEKKVKLQDIGQNDNNNNNKKEKKQKEDEINIFDDEPEEEPKKKKNNQNNMTIKFRDRKLEGQLDMLRLNVYRKAFQTCWLGILSLPLSDSTYKKILASTHTHIFPSMVKPSLLIDFLTEAYDRGGIYSILALHGVFMLMSQHGLEYPDFYNKLYAILDETIFTAKYRVRFWRLLDLFFTSSHLPQYVVAAFIKKMSRLALTAPAHGSIVAQVFAYTLLQRHPSCAPLVHKLAQKPMTKSVLLIGENATKNYSQGIPVEELEGFDHYKVNEKDTAKSDALQSSLWELQVMSLHYLPAVSRLTKIFQSIGKIYSVQDFDDESYQSLFEDEINRIVKEDFPLAFKDTDALFSAKDIAEGFDGWELS